MNKKKQTKTTSSMTLTDMAELIKSILSEDVINELGLLTKQSLRLRDVTPYKLALCLFNGMAGGKVDSLADLHREFNGCFASSVAYKAFYNRLSHQGFADFMKALCMKMLGAFSMKVAGPKTFPALCQFEDILLQDGTAFGLKQGIAPSFGEGLAAHSPVARLHAIMSVYQDGLQSVSLTGNKTAEPTMRPHARDLKGSLYMADRGYASLETFLEFTQEKASFIIRMPRNYDPMVIGVYDEGVFRPHLPTRLSFFIAQGGNHDWDLAVTFKTDDASWQGRVLTFRSKEEGQTRLCTNLCPKDFRAIDVGHLYRLRWQIELLFKEWKSHTNLTSFKTQNKHIAEGLIWASLATAILVRFVAHAAQHKHAKTISTMKVVKAAKNWIRKITQNIQRSKEKLIGKLKEIIRFLQTSATSSRPKRMRIKGKQNMGLRQIGATK